MLWKEFSQLVRPEKCASATSEKGKIAELLQHRGKFTEVTDKENEWYPDGASNDEEINGYRYVDINQSFFGKDSILISEASCCIIVVLLDPISRTRFCAHISAATDLKTRQWLAMKSDLFFFFKAIGFDMQRPELYLFCENFYKDRDGSYEQRILMNLFNSVLDFFQMRQLASSTWLIEGEDGSCWNPYCAVRLGVNNIHVSFASQPMNVIYKNTADNCL